MGLHVIAEKRSSTPVNVSKIRRPDQTQSQVQVTVSSSNPSTITPEDSEDDHESGDEMMVDSEPSSPRTRSQARKLLQKQRSAG